MMNAATDKLFLELIEMFTAQGQNLSPKTGTTYAPTKLAAHPKAKGYNKTQFKASMQRLLDAGVIKIVTDGPPSRQRSKLAVVELPTVH